MQHWQTLALKVGYEERSRQKRHSPSCQLSPGVMERVLMSYQDKQPTITGQSADNRPVERHLSVLWSSTQAAATVTPAPGDLQEDCTCGVAIGITSEEGVISVYGVFTKPVSAVECTVYTAAIFKQHALRILRKYLPLYKNADRRDMLSQIVTDYVFLCPSRKSARAGTLAGSSVWMYTFDHVASDHRVWSGLGFCYEHVCHGAELPFLFNSAPVANFTMTPPERLLANRMLCYWGAFAHAGDPASRVGQTAFCREQRPPAWPRYTDTSSWLVMNFTVRSHAQVGTRDHICDFWDKLGIY